jgi:hypothetical protein
MNLIILIVSIYDEIKREREKEQEKEKLDKKSKTYFFL